MSETSTVDVLDGSRLLSMLLRRAQIVELVQRKGTVAVVELSALFQVSVVTIRNDLDVLARQGVLIRDRGGAIALTKPDMTLAFERRSRLRQEEKRRIGRAAAQLVKAGETIIMDAGSTLFEMAHVLANVSYLTVVTNALNIASELSTNVDSNVILTGGSVNPHTLCTLGPHVERDLSELVVEKVFLGAHAVDLEAGLTDVSIEVAQAKRAMARAGRRVILLADSSKWGHASFVKVVPLMGINVLVSDSGLPSDACAALGRLGVELILV